MKDQWFLDLDGVKSGPYQTNEVLSLISDGEVLPHHLIGTALKAQEWKTILDWKLALSASATPKPAPTVVSETKKPAPADPIVKTPDSTIAPSVAVAPEKPESSAAPETDQDAMAEMFDTIHHTKLKREQKSQQEHAAAQPVLEPESQITSSTGKFILVSIAITILGFVLGQLFQKQNISNPLSNTTNSSTAVTSPSSSSAPAPAPGTEMQVLDRSNDRITIRSQLPTNSPPPPPAPMATMRPEIAPMERPNDSYREPEKDTQMMEELKKELSELKALKEEIRNNEYSDELPDNNTQGNNGGNAPLNPEPNPNPIQNPDQAPEANAGSNPGENATPPADEAHY